MKLWMKLVAVFLTAILLCSVLVWYQLHGAVEVKKQLFVVQAGASSHQVSKALQKQGVIDSALLFRLWARTQGLERQIKAGEYRFSGQLNIMEVLHQLVAGNVVLHQVTVPEGLWTDEILKLLAQRTATPLKAWKLALNDVLKGKESEGVLLPETYTYVRPVVAKVILKDMLEGQRAVIKAIAPKSVLKLRIIASIIEKETALDEERVWVSAAIHNRLALGMPLQMDPTVIYGIWRRDGVFSGNIHRQDLHTDTAWNTYTRKGLPPTPICNPGAASLKAAAHPAKVDYLYFVADGSGGHAFAASLAEHQANVRKWVKLERRKKP